ncbi:MAG: tRNA ((34)/cytosine(34)/5-carboxymethylaminomethyluridine(34)-2-O)-methyltransferase TrmL [Marmoricola sp.]|nr:tRNA ((34)/cytosine(34)/5-carboxymethylaminomethyluridine(34)-2-O)-methyltransferase TrmL [Marmoricola sp.]
MFHVMFLEPRIPPNTGNAIRMVAGTGATLHLVEPLGFDLSEPKLKRAGLDYHDLASVEVHADLDTALSGPSLAGSRVFAFTTQATRWFTDVEFQADDVLLFGPEPSGLPDDALHHPRVTDQLRIPMIAGRRSLNLSNSAAVVTYEAWRQHGFPGAQ